MCLWLTLTPTLMSSGQTEPILDLIDQLDKAGPPRVVVMDTMDGTSAAPEWARSALEEHKLASLDLHPLFGSASEDGRSTQTSSTSGFKHLEIFYFSDQILYVFMHQFSHFKKSKHPGAAFMSSKSAFKATGEPASPAAPCGPAQTPSSGTCAAASGCWGT